MYIGNNWDLHLKEEYQQSYFAELIYRVDRLYEDKIILPEKENIFKAFNYTDFDKVKCVIIGQDPYPRIGVPCGLSFSVNREASIPPSLRNIFNELVEDLDINYPEHGNLTSWSEQGVLLLNSILTVEEGKPNSHKNLGWQLFTNTCIHLLSENRENLIFMLWGKFAQSKSSLISDKHLVLETSHPSPHSVNLGFSGCGHFSEANNYLESAGNSPIDWRIN